MPRLLMPGILLYILLLISSATISPVAAQLPRSAPEIESVSPAGILDFINAADTSMHEFHSVMILRHGKVIAEGWWNPYKPVLKHTMYSVSKSFTSTAIGFAVKEKLLSVDDKVISFFPDKLPDTVSENLKLLAVKDLLTMSVGHATDPTFAVASSSTDWVKAFLAVPITHKPGTHFVYNSVATYMLSAIVQKLSGQNVLAYLTPRLFQPLGIEAADWEQDPNGINVGGWGLRVKTEDMAKLGQLYLDKGKWKGTQILPESWIDEATTAKLVQAPQWADSSTKETNDWIQGYGYQFWRCRNNAYRADGAYGQYIIVIPEKDAIVAITSETQDMQGQLNMVYKYLLPAMKDGKIKEKKKSKELRNKLSSLSLLEINPFKKTGNIPNRQFTATANDKGFSAISFKQSGDVCTINLKTDSTNYDLSFGLNKLITGETNRPGPSLIAAAKTNIKEMAPYPIAGSYQWLDEHTIQFTLRYIMSPHSENWVFRFNENDTDITLGISAAPALQTTFKAVANP